MTNNKRKIGILALQGAFAEHRVITEKLGAEVFLVRSLADVSEQKIDGLILPGGESTTIKKLLKKTGLDAWLKKAVRGGLPVFATCAGLIILADMGLLDVRVERNAYGSQLNSFETDVRCQMSDVRCQMFHAIFIRAPKILSVGKDVEILAEHKKTPVLVRQDNILAASFHPELTDNGVIHGFFLAYFKNHR